MICPEKKLLRNRVHLSLLGLILAATLMIACGPREAGELPPVGLKVAFEKHNIPSEMAAGEKSTVEVRFKNSSTMTWPSKANSRGKFQVNFSYHWLSSKGEMVVFDGLRTGLPNDIKVGETVQLQPTIMAPDRPGSYLLEMTLVQEGNAWFPEADGDNKVTVPVNVSAAKTAASTAPALAPTAPLSEKSAKNAEAKNSDKPVEESKENKEKAAEKKSRKDKKREAREKSKKDAPEGGEVKKDLSWAVQVGAFPDEKDANATVTRLKDKGYNAFVTRGEIKGKRWYRVRVGRLASRAEAETLQKKLASQEKTGQSVIVANR